MGLSTIYPTGNTGGDPLQHVYDRTAAGGGGGTGGGVQAQIKKLQLKGALTANLPPGYARPAGVGTADPQFDLTMEFGASTGQGTTGFSPNATITADTEYYVRAKISQHQVAPLITGVTMQWSLPAGWVWVDGLGNLTMDELPSNPGYVCRVAKSPHSPSDATISATITERFL